MVFQSQPPQLPPGVSLISGNGGLATLVIDRAECQAAVCLYGAQLLSWKPAGQAEVLFLSKESSWKQGKAIRGGIPVCFPWFRAKADNPTAPSHGFARTRVWQLDSVTEVDGGVQISLSTRDDAESERWWPHAFHLEHRITVGRELTLELVTHNTGATEFRFEEAQHTYYRVDSVTGARVEGLDGATYLDNTRGNAQAAQVGPVALGRQTDNAYQGTDAPLLLQAGDRTWRISKQGSESTVIWNPWSDGAAKLTDLGDDEWEHFLCVEAANIMDRAVTLGPGARHALVTHVEIAG